MPIDTSNDDASLPSLSINELLPLVYDELRALAARKLQGEKLPLTLQPTALVHEVWLRLVRSYPNRCWNNQREFFLASAEVMRRILVDRARRKNAERHGGALARIEFPRELQANLGRIPDLVGLDDLLTELERYDALHAEYVKTHFFVGFTHAETAAALGLSSRQADRIWKLARAWLRKNLSETKNHG